MRPRTHSPHHLPTSDGADDVRSSAAGSGKGGAGARGRQGGHTQSGVWWVSTKRGAIRPPVLCDYLTSERRRNSSPKTRGMTIQIIVVEPSIDHSSPVFVAPSKSSTCV